MLAAATLMEELANRRAEAVVPSGRPAVALTPGPKLLATDVRSRGRGDVEPKGQVLSHCTLMQLGSREAAESDVYRQ